MSTDAKQPPFTLEFDEADNMLFGVVPDIPKDTPAPTVTGFHIRTQLGELGYQDFLITPANFNNFLKNLKNRKPGRYILGERRDAKVDIQISSDRLSATIKISKAWGGKRLNNAKIIEVIRHNKIAQECILVEELKKVAANHKEDLELVFAKGRLPVAGEDARLEPLLKAQVAKLHNTESEEAIDQRDVYEFAVVEVGQPLLRKIPATPGKPGKDVLGKQVPAQAGRDIVFATPFEGVEFTKGDENVLVAAIKGHPVFSKTGVKVDPVLHLESVGIHSGNIDYDGSVFVKQNVASGFTVKATGDIHVKGQVEKANLIARGNIIVGTGILGEEEDGKLKARLSCEGNLHARFINLAFIHCGGSVHVDEYILQSRVVAKGDILVGEDKGRGRIIGGLCSSESSIKAKTLGSDACVPTSLVLGSEANENQELNRLHAEHERREHELEQLKVILTRIQASNSQVSIGKVQLDKTAKIRNTIAALENQVSTLEAEIKQLEESRGHGQYKVHVSGTIFPNVSISICGKGWHCEEEMRHQSFYLEQKQLAFSTLES